MLPVVSPAEMRDIDAAAAEPLAVLIERAGWAAARAVRTHTGPVAGRRIVVMAGPGNNGADGVVAARILQRWGAAVEVLDVRDAPSRSAAAWARVDVVVDAGYGTGLRSDVVMPAVPPDRPVVAIDIPSGVDGSTGEVRGNVIAADATVTFGALKPGLVFGAGRQYCGTVEVAPLGLDTSGARCHLLEADDLERWPTRPTAAHKWQSAVLVVGGSRDMTGAPCLAAAAAARAGAGYVLVSVPGCDGPIDRLPIEAVARPVSADWGVDVLGGIDRVGAVVLGPGLAVDGANLAQLRVVLGADVPLVVDAGAIDAVAAAPDSLVSRRSMAVITPHDGEFERLTGRRPGPDRLAAARDAAARLGAVVVLKGPVTVIAHPDGRALLGNAGDERLATAGTGDVLAGVIGAGLAQGLEPFLAAGLAVELHGRAALLGLPVGLVAGDLPPLLARWLSDRRDLT